MLTERQSKFIAALLRGDTDAAAAAAAAGYSPARARRQAAELLRRPEIAEALAAARDESGAEAVDKARIVRELARIAFADPADLLDAAEGSLTPAEARRRIGGTGLKLKYTPRRGAGPGGETVFELALEREVRVGDKLRALELLSRTLGLAGGGGDGDDAAEATGVGVVLLPEVEE